MKTPHIITSSAVVAIIEGQNHSAQAGTIKHKRVLDAINKNDDEAFILAMNLTEGESKTKEIVNSGFEVLNGEVYLDDIKIVGPLNQKLSRMIAEGYDVSHFVTFVRNLRRNPSRSAVSELYDFLGYSELPITENGKILAYKGVTSDYWSITAGETKLKKGLVDESGYIFNGVGEEIECERVEVDDDRRNSCSNGLHVGSHDYARSFAHNGKVILVEVDPADVVSVPLDCSCQKMRVCGYKVVSDYKEEIKHAVVNSTGQGVESSRSILARKIDDRVSSLNKSGKVTIKRIQSALSPECPPLHEIRDILINKLGYDVGIDPNHKTSVGHMIVS